MSWQPGNELSISCLNCCYPFKRHIQFCSHSRIQPCFYQNRHVGPDSMVPSLLDKQFDHHTIRSNVNESAAPSHKHISGTGKNKSQYICSPWKRKIVAWLLPLSKKLIYREQRGVVADGEVLRPMPTRAALNLDTLCNVKLARLRQWKQQQIKPAETFWRTIHSSQGQEKESDIQLTTTGQRSSTLMSTKSKIWKVSKAAQCNQMLTAFE